ncbi:hypothetical protein JCM10908_006334 [Rhodotorula pacifica]|uniref:uncharacterized protein n=1 Tax=Rhodotorula pacifica TaxID=1495444 RepID=UPI0031752242
MEARALNAATSANLLQAGIASLDLNFRSRRDVDFAALPWEDLEKLDLVFRFGEDDAIDACLARLGEQSLDGSKATKLRALSVDFDKGVTAPEETVLSTLCDAFQHCQLETLTVKTGITEAPLNLNIDAGWPTLTRLQLDLFSQRIDGHRFETFSKLLRKFNALRSLTLRNFAFASCDCCHDGIDLFIELEEKAWSVHGHALLALIHFVRHCTGICDLRIQDDNTDRELRWTRMDASQELVSERWTLY